MMFRGIYQFGKTKIFVTLIVTAICFVFTWLYYGFYYVEYEALFDSFYSGKLTEGMPFRSIYFLGNIGTSYLYSSLYQINPHIEWISWILYTYLFITCSIGLYLVIDLIPESVPWWLKIFIQIIIYFLVFADQNIHFIFTRVSYMVTGISLIALVYFFRAPGSIKRRPWLFVALNLWFVTGVLTRFESGAGIFIQVGFFGLLYLQNIRRFALLFLFPLLLLVSISGVITHDIRTTTQFYKQIEPDIEEQFCDRGNAVPIADMKTYRDSVMWRTAMDIMWSDPKVLNPSYLRSLIRPEKFIFTDSSQWQRVYYSVSAIAFKFWYLGIISVLLGISLLIQIRYGSPGKIMLWFTFFTSFWVLILVQTYLAKVNDRCFSPPISLFIFCNLLLLFANIKSGTSRWIYPLLTAVLILSGFQFHYLKTESNQLQSDLKDYRKDLGVITSVATGKILVVNSSSCNFLVSANEPFHPFNFSAFRKIYITDGYNMPFLPYYRRYLEKECNCDIYDFPDFWDYLRTKHDEVVIVSTYQRMDIIKEYLSAIHRYNLPVSDYQNAKLFKLEESGFRGFYSDLRLYRLGR